MGVGNQAKMLAQLQTMQSDVARVQAELETATACARGEVKRRKDLKYDGPAAESTSAAPAPTAATR